MEDCTVMTYLKDFRALVARRSYSQTKKHWYRYTFWLALLDKTPKKAQLSPHRDLLTVQEETCSWVVYIKFVSLKLRALLSLLYLMMTKKTPGTPIWLHRGCWYMYISQPRKSIVILCDIIIRKSLLNLTFLVFKLEGNNSGLPATLLPGSAIL